MKTSTFEHCNIIRQVLGLPTERQKQLADRGKDLDTWQYY